MCPPPLIDIENQQPILVPTYTLHMHIRTLPFLVQIVGQPPEPHLPTSPHSLPSHLPRQPLPLGAIGSADMQPYPVHIFRPRNTIWLLPLGKTRGWLAPAVDHRAPINSWTWRTLHSHTCDPCCCFALPFTRVLQTSHGTPGCHWVYAVSWAHVGKFVHFLIFKGAF